MIEFDAPAPLITIKKWIGFALMPLALWANGVVAQPTDQSLNGPWQVIPATLIPANAYDATAVSSAQWQGLTIPANWHLGGYEWSGAVWHRRMFDVDPVVLQNQSSLRFDAVDYAADVWLNGHYLGFHQGYFEPFWFNVSGLLKPQNNVLSVRVDSPDEMPDQVWSLHKKLIKGVLNHHDTRPGGAWSLRGQESNSGGIWQSVSLHHADALTIEHLSVRTETPEQGQIATLRANITLNTALLTGQRLTARMTLTPIQGGASQTTTQTVTLGATGQPIDLIWPSLQVDRWWPKGEGPQTRYHFVLEILAGDQPLDRIEQDTAFRSIRFDAAHHAFLINGRRLFLRGTNYIASPWLASMTRDRYTHDIELMQAANINAVRVHAHVTGNAFYDQADQLGLLVWQDFPLQWGYEDTDAFAQEAVRQAHAMTHLLAAHPSIFTWSAHNEPPWNADWMKYKYDDYDPMQNWQLTHRVADALADDPTRYRHGYSATGEHLWMGWYSGNWRDHNKASRVSIVSEFGAQALPDVATLEGIIPPNDLWPATTDPKDPNWQSWEYHNFQPLETFKNAGVQRGDSLESFVDHSQHYQARLVQLAAESYRRQRYAPVAAVFHFMFNETWPSINWGIVDYQRKPKLGYFALQQAYQPILPSIAWDQSDIASGKSGQFTLWAINDTQQHDDHARLTYQILNIKNNTIITSEHKTFALAADTGKPIWSISVSSLADGDYALLARIDDKKGRSLGQNRYDFHVGTLP
jgi:beta-mannosidase